MGCYCCHHCEWNLEVYDLCGYQKGVPLEEDGKYHWPKEKTIGSRGLAGKGGVCLNAPTLV